MRRLFIVVLAVVCGWVAYAVYGQAAEGRALDARVDQLRRQDAALQQQIADRTREIAEAQSEAWLEEQARKLGYVMPGEKVYVIAGPGGAGPAQGGVPAALPVYQTPPPSPTPSPSPGQPSPGVGLQLLPASPSPSPSPSPGG